MFLLPAHLAVNDFKYVDSYPECGLLLHFIVPGEEQLWFNVVAQVLDIKQELQVTWLHVAHHWNGTIMNLRAVM